MNGQSTKRNPPALYNVAYRTRLFHDGREGSLALQIWSPLLAANEMGNPSIGYVIERIRSLADYAGLFEAAFEGKGVSSERIGAALASYERTLAAGGSRFDRWRFGATATALDPRERLGFEIFAGKGRCTACHLVGENSALFTDDGFHNTGVGWRRSFESAEKTRVEFAPGRHAELDRRTIESFSEAPAKDVGRYEITLDPKDRWAYRTPSLRNVELTAPYMHDGSLPSLEAVVEFYDRGGIDNPEKSPRIAPLGLSAEERAALVAFLKTLSGSGIEALVAEARATPIGQ